MSVLEITVGHRILPGQILNMSGQFHIMIGHHVRTFCQHILTSFCEVIVHPQNLVRYIIKGLDIYGNWQIKKNHNISKDI